MKLEELKGKIKLEAVIGLFLLVVVVAGGVFFFAGSATNDTQVATVSPPIAGDVGDVNNSNESAAPGSELVSNIQGYSFVPIYSVLVPTKPVTPQKPSSPQKPATPSESDDDYIEIPFDELPDDIKDILFPGWRDNDQQDDDPTDGENQTDDEDDLWDFPEAPEEDLDPDDVELPGDDDGFPEDGPQEENPDEETPDAPDDIGETEEPDPLEDEDEFPEDVPDDIPDDDWIDDWING